MRIARRAKDAEVPSLWQDLILNADARFSSGDVSTFTDMSGNGHKASGDVAWNSPDTALNKNRPVEGDTWDYTRTIANEERGIETTAFISNPKGFTVLAWVVPYITDNDPTAAASYYIASQYDFGTSHNQRSWALGRVGADTNYSARAVLSRDGTFDYGSVSTSYTANDATGRLTPGHVDQETGRKRLVGFVYRGSETSRLVVDGKFVPFDTLGAGNTTYLHLSSCPITIGSLQYTSSSGYSAYQGGIQSVMVWDRELSRNEVQRIYHDQDVMIRANVVRKSFAINFPDTETLLPRIRQAAYVGLPGQEQVLVANLTAPSPGDLSVDQGGGTSAGTGSADWDDARIWWSAQACCCGPSGDSGIPPTINFSSDGNVIDELGRWKMNVPLGAEQNIYGSWTDLDNDLDFFERLQSIEIFIEDQNGTNSENRSGFGNMLIDNDRANSGTWSYSTSQLNLVDDQRWMKAVITDEQGLVGSARIQIDIPWTDITRESTAPAHPRPKQTVWYQQNLNFATTWVDPVPTGWGGANYIYDGNFRQGGYSGPVVNEPDNADHFIYTGGVEMSSLTPGNWRPQFQIHMKPPTDDVTMWLKVEVWVGPTTFIRHPQWTDYKDDYLRYTYVHEAAVGYYSPTGQDELNLTLDDDSGFPFTGFNVPPGEEILVRMVGGAYDSNGNVIASPTPFQHLPVLAFSHMEFEGVDPVPPPEPKETFFSWTAGDISKPVWDAYVGSLPIGPQGRPKGSNVLRKSFQSSAVDSEQYVQRLHIGHNYEVPTMDTGGVLTCDRRPEPEQNKHNQVVPSGSGHPAWTSAFYLKPYYDLEMIFEMTLEEPQSRSTWESTSFVTLLDLHPTSWGGAWTESFQAPLNVYITGGNLELRCRGSDEEIPTRYTHSAAVKVPIPSIGVSHSYKIRYKIAPVSPGESYAELYINGQLQGRIDNQPIGINHSAVSVPGALWTKVGCYCQQDSTFVTKLSSLQISELL